MKIKTQSTVYPYGYDKNGASNRHTQRFCRGFNKWCMFIRQETMSISAETAMNNALESAKNLIGL